MKLQELMKAEYEVLKEGEHIRIATAYEHGSPPIGIGAWTRVSHGELSHEGERLKNVIWHGRTYYCAPGAGQYLSGEGISFPMTPRSRAAAAARKAAAHETSSPGSDPSASWPWLLLGCVSAAFLVYCSLPNEQRQSIGTIMTSFRDTVKAAQESFRDALTVAKETVQEVKHISDMMHS
ncbi:unnamed protein product [Cuscuta epithymum]|uniref:Uncharacterized protein n=1 Tax=Cuscuta epithymum TaxID=186058 RepID=A0AAV0EYD2_9ASTE|nr:unnamed protein product [Cuscuta epithymum]CAH9128262.1 unnamed protein product [Cuscuta epithymum]CAH9128264.1 unnamed protein product [Cuscuta epithymum]CAH9128265.1 unnamed protein product [Cuscuta epithymum]CAH9128269.1 unnamed protein product [Cuscuta epithymum]